MRQISWGILMTFNHQRRELLPQRPEFKGLEAVLREGIHPIKACQLIGTSPTPTANSSCSPHKTGEEADESGNCGVKRDSASAGPVRSEAESWRWRRLSRACISHFFGLFFSLSPPPLRSVQPAEQPSIYLARRQAGM